MHSRAQRSLGRQPEPPTAAHAAAALRYAQHGWPVIPLHAPLPDGSCSCRRPDCAKPGKHPRTPHGIGDGTLSARQIEEWWSRWPAANVGVATGRLLVLDVDGPTGRRALVALERAHQRLPSTLQARTGTGTHFYFDAAGREIRNSAGQLGEGLDVRGHGGYVIAPPSLHATGRRYRWQKRRPRALLPRWLADVLAPPTLEAAPRRPLPAVADTRRRRYFNAALQGELDALCAAPNGTRNDTLNRAAFRLGQLVANGLGELDDVDNALRDAAIAAGLSESEAAATIASGLQAGARHPRAARPGR